jgi:hypothetical protein
MRIAVKGSFVDSIDISTPERAIKNGNHPDKTWNQIDFEFQ